MELPKLEFLFLLVRCVVFVVALCVIPRKLFVYPARLSIVFIGLGLLLASLDNPFFLNISAEQLLWQATLCCSETLPNSQIIVSNPIVLTAILVESLIGLLLGIAFSASLLIAQQFSSWITKFIPGHCSVDSKSENSTTPEILYFVGTLLFLVIFSQAEGFEKVFIGFRSAGELSQYRVDLIFNANSVSVGKDAAKLIIYIVENSLYGAMILAFPFLLAVMVVDLSAIVLGRYIKEFTEVMLYSTRVPVIVMLLSLFSYMLVSEFGGSVQERINYDSEIETMINIFQKE
jgi:hypothetical protein